MSASLAVIHSELMQHFCYYFDIILFSSAAATLTEVVHPCTSFISCSYLNDCILNSSPIDELGEGAYESGWWCQVKCNRQAGHQVSTATQRAATTARHRHTEKLSGDTCQPLYLRLPAKRKGRGGANCRTNAQFGAQNCMTSQSEYPSSKAQRRPVCRIGVHDPRTPNLHLAKFKRYR